MNPVPDWRNVFVAMILALALVGAGQSPQAQAAQDNPADVYFEVSANPQNPPTLCVNQKLNIYVSINKNITKVINDRAYNLPRGEVTGVQVNGRVSNDVGILAPEHTPGSYDLASLGVGQADFLFTAKKPGRTTLTFTADVPGTWTGATEAAVSGRSYRAKKAEIQVRVVRCKFKVTTIGEWRVPGPANLHIAATSGDAEVKAEEAQSAFSGSTTVNWVASIADIIDCKSILTIGSSQVSWTGTMNDADQLTLNGTYQPAAGSQSTICIGQDGGVATGNPQYQLTADPLQISIASSGGVVRQSQVLQGPEATPGFVTIIVIPQEDEAAAFNPGERVLHVGSPSVWRAALSDNFPWLYGAFMTLRP